MDWEGGWGNLLGPWDSQIHTYTRTHTTQFYLAPRMTLSIVGKEPLDRLQKWAETMFAQARRICACVFVSIVRLSSYIRPFLFLHDLRSPPAKARASRSSSPGATPVPAAATATAVHHSRHVHFLLSQLCLSSLSNLTTHPTPHTATLALPAKRLRQGPPHRPRAALEATAAHLGRPIQGKQAHGPSVLEMNPQSQVTLSVRPRPPN